MTWICPNCKKEFRNKNQAHSCARVEVEAHLLNKSLQVRAAFDKLMKELRKFGEITLNPVKTSIQVKAVSTFLSIRPKKTKIEIEFQLGSEVNATPVYKNFRISRNRVLHFAVLNGPEDVNASLMSLLRKSYDLIKDNP